MIHVIATIETASGQRPAVLEALRSLVPLVRAEAGCVEYGPAVDVASGLASQVSVREDTIVMLEKWRDLEALKAHLCAPHMVEFRARVKEAIGKIELQVLEPA